MFRIMVLLKRDPGATTEDFRTWWLTDHVQLARRIPGLVGYTVNLSTDPDAPFDGISELVFESETAWQTAQSSPELARARADSEARTSHRVSLFVTHHPVVGPATQPAPPPIPSAIRQH